jgi:translation initiation factor IF-3
MSHPERGEALLMRLAEDVADLGVIEQRPNQDGRNMTMLLGPSKAVLAGTVGAAPATDENGATPAADEALPAEAEAPEAEAVEADEAPEAEAPEAEAQEAEAPEAEAPAADEPPAAA